MRHFIHLFVVLCFAACQGSGPGGRKNAVAVNEKTRIVSLNGAFTEILCAAGLEQNIVGVDVTSTYPASLASLPKVGHNRNIQAEGILSLTPDVVIGNIREIKPELVKQLTDAGISVLMFDHEYSVAGTEKLIRQVTDTLGKPDIGDILVDKLQRDLRQVQPLPHKSRVMFIYARGAKTLNVSGKDTKLARMIELAGGENAFNDFTEFKPLNAEALVVNNPDVILMFSTGLESLDGVNGLKGVAGISDTRAARHNAVITMDDQLLAGFGPRLGEAVAELNRKLREVSTHE